MKKSFKHMTEEEYDRLKSLLAAGLSQKQVSEFTGRSRGTISTIAKSATLAFYNELTARKSHKKPVVVQVNQAPKLPAERIIDLLEEIRNEIAKQNKKLFE